MAGRRWISLPPVIGPFDPQNSANGGSIEYTVGGIGWYRKEFRLPGDGHVELRFDGVYQMATARVTVSVADLGATPQRAAVRDPRGHVVATKQTPAQDVESTVDNQLDLPVGRAKLWSPDHALRISTRRSSDRPSATAPNGPWSWWTSATRA